MLGDTRKQKASANPGNSEEAHVATTGLHGQAGVPHNHRHRDESTPWSRREDAGSLMVHAHGCVRDGEPQLQPLHQQRMS